MSAAVAAMPVSRLEGAEVADGGAQDVHGVAGEGELGQGPVSSGGTSRPDLSAVVNTSSWRAVGSSPYQIR